MSLIVMIVIRLCSRSTKILPRAGGCSDGFYLTVFAWPATCADRSPLESEPHPEGLDGESADTAQDLLSLPNRPEVQMDFRIKNNPSMTRNGTKVDPTYSARGGGRKYMTTGPVEVEIINVQPCR